VASVAAAGRRRLLLRDAVTFLTLLAITVVLFALTLLLFRSFEAHREDLGRRWSERGRAALSAGKPEQAVTALRTALTYSPTERGYELLLAQALAAAGPKHTEEAYNYFTGLWDARPGDGLINLQLARLAARKGDRQQAVNSYRASIYGTWEGDGVERRREVRLELARYLLSQGDDEGARVELLVAGGNSPESPQLDVQLGRLLERARAQGDAMRFYRKALAMQPMDPEALEASGRLAFAAGDYAAAHELLRSAVKARRDGADPALVKMEQDSARLLELDPAAGKISVPERADRVMNAAAMARHRLGACSARPAGLPEIMRPLQTRWTEQGRINSRLLLRDEGRIDGLMQLVFTTEAEANRSCGAAEGDDALLLLLAKPHGPQGQ
jgi:tetratricopeptide (TPR) repeat protein